MVIAYFWLKNCWINVLLTGMPAALFNSTRNTGIRWKNFMNALWNLRNMIILKRFCTFFLLFQNFTLFKVYPWCIFWCWKCTKFPTNLKKYTTPRCTPYEDYTLVIYLWFYEQVTSKFSKSHLRLLTKYQRLFRVRHEFREIRRTRNDDSLI